MTEEAVFNLLDNKLLIDFFYMVSNQRFYSIMYIFIRLSIRKRDNPKTYFPIFLLICFKVF